LPRIVSVPAPAPPVAADTTLDAADAEASLIAFKDASRAFFAASA